MENFQSLVALAPWNIINALINLLILTLGVKHFLFKPVQAILQKRQEQINASYSEASIAMENAKVMEAEYTAHLANAKAEASTIVKDANARAIVHGEEIITSAKAEADHIRIKAHADIITERKNAALALKNDISNIALGIAGKVVEKEIDANTHRALIDEFIENMGDAS